MLDMGFNQFPRYILCDFHRLRDRSSLGDEPLQGITRCEVAAFFKLLYFYGYETFRHFLSPHLVFSPIYHIGKPFYKCLSQNECIKVKAVDYPGYRPNFCFEKKWDWQAGH
jgi:hypothetical protein